MDKWSIASFFKIEDPLFSWTKKTISDDSQSGKWVVKELTTDPIVFLEGSIFSMGLNKYQDPFIWLLKRF